MKKLTSIILITIAFLMILTSCSDATMTEAAFYKTYCYGDGAEETNEFIQIVIKSMDIYDDTILIHTSKCTYKFISIYFTHSQLKSIAMLKPGDTLRITTGTVSAPFIDGRPYTVMVTGLY